MLTELEGAILAEIKNGGYETAFQVRRAFATSLFDSERMIGDGGARTGQARVRFLPDSAGSVANHPHDPTSGRCSELD